MRFNDPIIKQASKELDTLPARLIAATQGARVYPPQLLLRPSGLLLHVSNSLIWESLDPDLVHRILRGELDATALQLEDLAQFGRKKHFIQVARPPVIPGWRPDKAPLVPLPRSAAVIAINTPCSNETHDLLLLDRLTSRPETHGSKQSIQKSTRQKWRRQAPAATVAFGTAAAMLLFVLVGPPRSNETTATANAKPSWDARELAASELTPKSEAAAQSLTAIPTHSPETLMGNKPVPAAKSTPSSVQTVIAKNGAIAESPVPAVAIKAATSSPAERPKESLLPSVALARQSRPQHRQMQARRSIETRRDALSTSPRRVAAISVPVLPDVLKPQ